jgi:penicillin-binding protein 1A
MPEDVVSIGDELYFDDFTPGHGFISTVGVSQATLDEASGTSAAAPEQVGEQEKKDIMNLFKGH